MRRKPEQDGGGSKAREAAERTLAAVRARRPAVEHQARQLRAYREENDLARKFWAAMGGKPT